MAAVHFANKSRLLANDESEVDVSTLLEPRIIHRRSDISKATGAGLTAQTTE